MNGFTSVLPSSLQLPTISRASAPMPFQAEPGGEAMLSEKGIREFAASAQDTGHTPGSPPAPSPQGLHGAAGTSPGDAWAAPGMLCPRNTAQTASMPDGKQMYLDSLQALCFIAHSASAP